LRYITLALSSSSDNDLLSLRDPGWGSLGHPVGLVGEILSSRSEW
jgi:hypothetical protein